MNYGKKSPQLWAAIKNEEQRQQDTIELIASENIVSDAVREAQGSVLTNKYAEGYPNKRYYGGCEFIDQVEQLAIDYAKKLFDAAYVNVQPHSGSQANMAVYQALLKPGDVILGMGMDAGGHLTHGATVNFSGKLYKTYGYGLNSATEELDYDEIMNLAKKVRPQLIVAGASAYSRIIDWQAFRKIADEVGAYLMVDMAHIAGLVATGAHPSPIPVADVVTTTTHKTLRGPRGGMILSKSVELGRKINSAVFPGIQGGPLEHVIAGKAQAFYEDLQPEYTKYIQQVVKNAAAMGQVFKASEQVRVVSGKTENHLLVLDLTKTGLTGKDAQNLLDRIHITTNKEAIPNDPRSPFITSGLRIGTPAITSRGFKEEDAQQVAELIITALTNPTDEEKLQQVAEQVQKLTAKYPIN
ncbi:serine hydroxymethyltransferase [Limosilactobacillus caviae]|uniref:Serine hydroxymethyltransferase n=1 Tax=Limosilactobacillus caviae TaxID=1769424 RepID=A0ABQ2C7F8_9LACO|nr:serine hydroxymethyltransferase [Limosilactobacillus caviae]MCD7125369.1 serine hydroxymethyltransferase [Limosilactobacillus caviae]MRH46424.1 aminotransferase class I/II-fold pyridoxal phosphate-dependent enzyme [Limosilactobacillus reuteri]GGI63259.1 serine hydroxymethyltransferase [Limosilactobacillus caviae]